MDDSEISHPLLIPSALIGQGCDWVGERARALVMATVCFREAKLVSEARPPAVCFTRVHH